MASSQLSWRWSAILVSFAALCLRSVSAQSYSGCYSSSGDLVNEGYWAFQSEGYCQPLCSGKGAAVYGLSDASYCWCGDELPAVSSIASSSNCNMNCTGYPGNICGGAGYWSVWLTGLKPTVGHAGSSTSTTSSQSSGSTSQTSVITSTRPGATIFRTITGSGSGSGQTGTSTPSGSSNGGGGGGSNVAAVAAGVTVGIVGLAAVIGGVLFYLRRQKQRHEEDEYRRQNQVSNFIRGGDGKPSMTGYSQMSDARLDPEAGNRRNSHGSIADNQDYSRRILRVANPDST